MFALSLLQLTPTLCPQCRLDRTASNKGIKVPDAEMAKLNIKPADFHGEWNYTFTHRTPDD
jgi:hypothetical protein